MWAKIDDAIAEDTAVADLLGSNPLAVALFAMCLPRADLYGILPGEPRVFKARVCPVAEMGVLHIEMAIADLVNAGLLHAYEVDGKPYLYVVRYHRYQDVRWGRVGAPQSPLPDCWECPDDLRNSSHYARLIDGRRLPETPGVIPETPGVSRSIPDTPASLGPDTDTDTNTDVPPPPPHAGARTREAGAAPMDGVGERLDEGPENGNGAGADLPVVVVAAAPVLAPTSKPGDPDPNSPEFENLRSAYPEAQVEDLKAYRRAIIAALKDANVRKSIGLEGHSAISAVIGEFVSDPPLWTNHPRSNVAEVIRRLAKPRDRPRQTTTVAPPPQRLTGLAWEVQEYLQAGWAEDKLRQALIDRAEATPEQIDEAMRQVRAHAAS